jgi:hypothetical protein
MMEKLDRRFGTVAIESGFITVGQLVSAMKIQIQDELKGAKHRLIGKILLDEGYITDIQIEEVLKTMRL